MTHLQHSDDSDSDELPARLRSMTLTSQANVSSNPPPYQRTAPLSMPSGLLPVYQYSAPTEQRLTNLWSEAGAASQGVPGGHVHIVTQHRAGTARRGKRYVVFHGLQCGVYDSWNITKPLVHGVSGALHRSYPTPELAHAAFDYAAARSWTRVIDPTGASHDRAIPYLPQPVFTVNIPSSMEPNPLHPGENIQDNKWYIVYKGICPGVYRSYLESQLNVKGISAATHESVAGTKDFAIAKYLQAVEDGDVAVISPSYTRYI
ncbi:hypothetical protein B0H14DRAFT_3770868 [Mycena olivaceomarginata]|nr:hypothetical protein B0H14DRAFT_3770868 [Mycena olivaceomarginata]